ncbi:hypothetical protein QFC21_004831 [Naganishia friedmannii]|uniref:Uncharacterized protein n=1 Tax=Naganishia friedmannii TaxID=89922 RepID=A0ACC2VCY2_9TREE|nr:hypothetical protein QFC21_004831 [Naganishia friedmannii]
MPSKHSKAAQKPASKKALPMPYEDDDSEVDEFETERRQRGMYDDSDENSEDQEVETGSEDEDGSEAESSAMARRRFAGWEQDELDGQEEEFTEESGEEEEDDSENEEEDDVPKRDESAKSDQGRLANLRKDLEQIPLSELLKAQRKLNAKRSHGSDSNSDSETESSSRPASASTSKNRVEAIKRQLLLMQQKKGKALDVEVPRVEEEDLGGESDGPQEAADPRDGGEGSRNNLWQVRKERKEDRAREVEWEERRAQEKEKRKRDNKHAPMVMSAKRQVTRRRQVVELEKTERRDPRFGSLSAGTQDPNLTAQSYSFVSGLMSEEYHNLRKALKVALRQERSAPYAEQDQRRQEREEVEMHLAKARSRFERYEREQREKKVLQEVKKEEKAKRAEGKGEWYMKSADKKDLLLKARFQALEKEGGKRKVKKAIEKKQKKIAGKEKKSRPFARGQGGPGGEDTAKKRRRVG